MSEFLPPIFERKIFKPEELCSELELNWRPLVFTNGCFDILHRGHVTYLAQSKCLGKTLIVAINTDQSVRAQNKGDDRPLNSVDNRMAVIASLEAVDIVTYFNDNTPLQLILKLRPDVLVKGGDWDINNIVGSKEVLSYGGAVYSIPFIHDTSTTKIINRIRREF